MYTGVIFRRGEGGGGSHETGKGGAEKGRGFERSLRKRGGRKRAEKMGQWVK